jgi:hypothetical protein
MFVFDCQQDLLLNGSRRFVCHEKTLRVLLRAVACTGRCLRSGLEPDLGKPTERWGRKVTGLKAHRKVSPRQPDCQTGVRMGSFVASFA